MRTALVLSSLLVFTACPAPETSSTGGGSGGGTAATGGGDATGGGTAATGGGTGTGGGTVGGPVLPRPDRSTPVALTSDDTLVIVCNPDNDTVSVISTTTNSKVTSVTLPAGSMPVSIALHPNNTEAYVVLRKAQKLVKITGLNTLTPAVATAEAIVGSEPTGVALSPTGATAIVANFGEDTVSIVDTAAMTATRAVVGPNPRAVAITNNLDGSDADEKAYVTLFYGTPNGEAVDNGRTGKVVPIPLSTKTPGTAISLAPIADTGFANALADGGTSANVGCSPNQLFGIAIDSGKVYVTHVCAAPKGPVNPLTNLFAGLSVITIATDTEDTSATGSMALSRLIKAQDTAGTGSLLGVPVAIDFKSPGIAYLLSQAGDVVQRIQYQGTNVFLGNAAQFAQIDIRQGGTGGSPAVKAGIGLVTAHNTATGTLWTNNWIDRSVSVVTLSGTQQVSQTVRSEALPQAADPAFKPWTGKKFYFTGTGRWSTRGVNSCGSCHPDGLSDNITWVFAAGPRQTLAMDATFAKSGNLEQRALNWTAVFDEIHDFEGNTRGTAGGVGALVFDTTLAVASRLDQTVGISLDGGAPVTRNDNLSGSARQLMLFRSPLRDWDDIDEYSKTIHANKAPTGLGDVTAGKNLFTQGKCQNCHGGAKWTTSRVSFTPTPDKNGSAAGFTDAGTAITVSGLRTQALTNNLSFAFTVNRDTTKLSVERLTDGGTVGPERIACVLRDVRTFSSADAIEKKADGTQAQGENGFNPPSLLGLATSAPYMHAGAAASLDEVLTDARFASHLTAGNQNFTLTSNERAQLVAFLKSIDDGTTPIAPDSNGTDICAGY